MPTYTPLQSIQLTEAKTSVVFSGIPQNYQDLVLVCNAISPDTVGPSVLAYLNGDTGSNYSNTTLGGNGTTASSRRRTSTNYLRLMDDGGVSTTVGSPQVTISHFMNYSNTTTYKTVISRGSTPTTFVEVCVSLWRNVSAINTIEVLVAGGLGYAAGTTFDLYGISPVAATNAQAAGEQISTTTLLMSITYSRAQEHLLHTVI